MLELVLHYILEPINVFLIMYCPTKAESSTYRSSEVKTNCGADRKVVMASFQADYFTQKLHRAFIIPKNAHIQFKREMQYILLPYLLLKYTCDNLG